MSDLGDLLRKQLAGKKISQPEEEKKSILSQDEQDVVKSFHEDRVRQTPTYKNSRKALEELGDQDNTVIGYQKPGFFSRIFLGKKPSPISISEDGEEVSVDAIDRLERFEAAKDLGNIGSFGINIHKHYAYPESDVYKGPDGGLFVVHSNTEEPKNCFVEPINITLENLEDAVNYTVKSKLSGVETYIKAINEKRELMPKQKMFERARVKINEDTKDAVEQFKDNINQKLGSKSIEATSSEKRLVNLLNERSAELYTEVDSDVYEEIRKIKEQEGLSFSESAEVKIPASKPDVLKKQIAEVHQLNSGAQLVCFHELYDLGYQGIPGQANEARYMLVENDEDLEALGRIYEERLANYRPDTIELDEEEIYLQDRIGILEGITQSRENDLGDNAEIGAIIKRHTGQGDDTAGDMGMGRER